MSTDQLLYPMDFSSHQDEWLDLDNLFQNPSDYLDSNPTSVESISPRDLDQSFTDADFLNWDSDPAVYSQAVFPDFVGYEAPVEGLDQSALEFQSFINPNDVFQSMPPPSQNQIVDTGFESAWLTDAQKLGHSSSFRYMVESQAALDTRCFSQKEKRRDASIALHLQRVQNAPLSDLNTPNLSSNHLSSPNWSDSSLDATIWGRCSTTSTTSPASESQKSPPLADGSDPGVASMQLVLDLNMNSTTNVPKKQKPRSRAQRENYIKARKYGVCEKHRKQHKRCNCLEKAAASHLNMNASCGGADTITGLQTNHERILANTSPQPSAQRSPTISANTGPLRPPRQAVRAPRPDLSPTQALALAGGDQVTVRQPINSQNPNVSPTLRVHPSASPTSNSRVTTQNTHLLVTNGGSLSLPALYRDKDSQNKQQSLLRLRGKRALQTLPPSVDKQPVSPGRGVLNVRKSAVADLPLTERAVTVARKTAKVLFTFCQGSTTISSWSGFFLGRLAVFSSRLYIQSRKGMGFF